MEQYIHIIVRLVIMAWALYRFWQWSYSGPITKLWARIPVREATSKTNRTAVAPRKTKERSVVGATHIVILDDPKALALPMPASEDLKETGYIGQEEDISPDDIETDYKPVNSAPVPSADELYGDKDVSPDSERQLSSGVSFEQIGDAVNALVGGDPDEQQRAQAAKTLYDLQNTPLYEFITLELSSAIAMESLIKEYINEHGEINEKKANNLEEIRMRNFDITDFV